MSDEIDKKLKKRMNDEFNPQFSNLFGLLSPKEKEPVDEEAKRKAEYERIRKQNGQNFGR